MEISVRGGAHSAAGTAVCNGGLMIDLKGMRDVTRIKVEYDPENIFHLNANIKPA